jgi:hypothetical protein
LKRGRERASIESLALRREDFHEESPMDPDQLQSTPAETLDVQAHRDDDVSRHCRKVARKMRDGLVVPLLGAGANLCGRPPGAAWRLGSSEYLPNGGELAEYLAHVFDAPEELGLGSDLLRVSQFVDATDGSGELYQKLHRIFDLDYPPGPLHAFLAELAPSLREAGNGMQVILTTNYDDALERAFEARAEAFDLITYIVSSPKEFRGRFMHRPPGEQGRVIESANDYKDLNLQERTVILKLHGAVRRQLETWKEDNYVITEDDYIEYLSRMNLEELLPQAVTSRLRNSHFLFLGYSMRDWNLRVMLHRIWGEQELEYPSWAIQNDPDEMEQAVWAKRNVEILKLELGDYVEQLRAAVEESAMAALAS